MVAWCSVFADFQVHACDHDHDDHDDEPASTGFLPISLALVLFVTGLFVFDVFNLDCSSSQSASNL